MINPKTYYCAFYKGVLQNNLFAETYEAIIDHIEEEHPEFEFIATEWDFKEVVIVEKDEFDKLRKDKE